MPSPIVLLVNPAAGSGRAARRAHDAERVLRRLGPVRVETSRVPGDEARIAAEAARDGARAVVVLGGDGAVSHAARGLIGAGPAGLAVPLAVLAAGTGNDFARSLRLPARDVDRMAALIGAGATRTIDAGTIDGEPFVNAAGFGFDADVLERSLSPGLWRGAARYAGTALGRLFRYRGFRAALSATAGVGDANDDRDDGSDSFGTTGASDAGDAGTAPARHWLMIVLGNGQWFGGAFRIAPEARLDDGALDAIAIAEVRAVGRAALFAAALRGAHLSRAGVTTHRAAAFTLRFDTPPRYQADGELRQARGRRVRVGVLPRALRVVARDDG
jgi:diacylglycerol kinase (ATP)